MLMRWVRRIFKRLSAFSKGAWCPRLGSRHFSVFEERFGAHEEASGLFENTSAFSKSALVLRRRPQTSSKTLQRF
jgi:hypothetical protein